MQLNKNGFVYKVAYGMLTEISRPDRVNICGIFWRFIIMFFIGWPVNFLMFAAVWAWIFIWSFLFKAAYVDLKGEDTYALIYFKKWPKIRGHRIAPIWILLAAAVIVYFEKLFSLWSLVITSSITHWILGIALLLVFIIYILLGVRKTETAQIFKAYLQAKKDKLCPVIVCYDPNLESPTQTDLGST